MSELPNVLGVDVSSKKSATFNGSEFEPAAPAKLHNMLVDAKPGQLICWDAPLTGPKDADYPRKNERLDVEGTHVDDYAYSGRLIERFFNKEGNASKLREQGLRPPSGISTRHYSGMSHWAVTRALTGYPRVGPYDSEPRFPLAAGETQPATTDQTQLVEVHPAVALWLWIDPWHQGQRFTYKSGHGRRERVKDLTDALLKTFDEDGGVDQHLVYGTLTREELKAKIGESHDQLDAYVAWVLGRLWAAGTGEVLRLGDAQTGSFLLPRMPQVEDAWREEYERMAGSAQRHP